MRRQRWSCLCPQPRAYLCTQGQPHGLSSEAGRAPVRFSSYHPCQLAPEKRLSAHTGYNLTGVRLTSRWHLSFLVSPQLPAIHPNTFSATDTPGVPSGLVQLCLPHGHPAAPSDADRASSSIDILSSNSAPQDVSVKVSFTRRLRVHAPVLLRADRACAHAKCTRLDWWWL